MDAGSRKSGRALGPQRPQGTQRTQTTPGTTDLRRDCVAAHHSGASRQQENSLYFFLTPLGTQFETTPSRRWTERERTKRRGSRGVAESRRSIGKVFLRGPRASRVRQDLPDFLCVLGGLQRCKRSSVSPSKAVTLSKPEDPKKKFSARCASRHRSQTEPIRAFRGLRVHSCSSVPDARHRSASTLLNARIAQFVCRFRVTPCTPCIPWPSTGDPLGASAVPRLPPIVYRHPNEMIE